MSSCCVVGFFCLARGNRIRVNRPNRNGNTRSTSSSTGTWYAHYDTTIACLKDTFCPVDLRVYCPLTDDILPDNSVAFVIGKVFIQTGEQRSLIDAIHLNVFPGDVSCPTYQSTVPQFTYSFVYGIGSVSGEHQVLNDRSRVFPVSISEYLRDQMKSFQIM
jgi:hypothetical protein